MTNRKWFIDLSHWNTLSKDQAIELLQQGCIGFSVKIGQGDSSVDSMADEHIALAEELQIPYIVHHWVDPILNPRAQAEHFINLTKKYRPSGLAPDMEQYWINWDEWYRIVVLKQPGVLRTFSQTALLNAYRSYLLELKRLNASYSKLPIMPYSSQWFIHGYCRQLAVTIRDEADDYWNAYYLSWKQSDQDPNITWSEFHATKDSLNLKPDYLPNGITTWTAWQFAIMPRAGWSKLDVNVITDAGAERYFGSTPPPYEPPPPPEPGTHTRMQVAVPALNIRSAPAVLDDNDIGDLHQGDVIEVLNVAGESAWVEFEPGKWACAQQGSERYLQATEAPPTPTPEPEPPPPPPPTPEPTPEPGTKVVVAVSDPRCVAFHYKRVDGAGKPIMEKITNPVIRILTGEEITVRTNFSISDKDPGNGEIIATGGTRYLQVVDASKKQAIGNFVPLESVSGWK